MARNKSEIDIVAYNKTKRAFNEVDGSLRRLDGAVTKVAGAFALLAGGGAIGGFINNAISAGDKIQKFSLRLGATTEDLSRLKFAAEASGVSFETMTMGLQRMTRRVGEAAMGTGEARKALVELGLDAEKLNKLPLAEKFKLISEALYRVEDSGKKAALGAKIFDSEGLALLQIGAEEGAAGIQKLLDKSDALGQTLDTETSEKMATARQRIDEMNSSFEGLALTIGGAVAGPLAEFIGWLNHISGGETLEEQLDRANAKLLEFTEVLGANDHATKVVREEVELLTAALRGLADVTNKDTMTGFRSDIPMISTGPMDGGDDGEAEKKRLEALEKEREMTESLLDLSEQEYQLNEELNALIEERTDLFGSISEGYDDILGSAEGLKQATEAANEEFEKMLEKVDGDLDRAFEEMPEVFGGATEQMGMDWDRVVDGMQDAFADRIYRAFDEGISSFSDMADAMLDIFKRMVAEMVAEWAANAIFDLVINGVGGSSGSSGGGIIGAAASGFAIGGPAGAIIGGGLSLLGFSEGGIPDGPTSGYPTMLHGREAVIPVNDKNSIRGNVIVEGDAVLHGELKAMRRDIRDMRNAYLNRGRMAA